MCESCRGFFRRAVHSKRKRRCARHGHDEKCVTDAIDASALCVIDSRSGRSCAFCRYLRCLRAGMKVSKVSGNAPMEKRKKSVENVTEPLAVLRTNPEFHLTVEEGNVIKQVVEDYR